MLIAPVVYRVLIEVEAVMSGQAREVDAANVYGYTGTLLASSQAVLDRERVTRPGRRMRKVCAGTSVHAE